MECGKSMLMSDLSRKRADAGRLGGSVKSERKAEAVRINGMKGGRPKKNKK